MKQTKKCDVIRLWTQSFSWKITREQLIVLKQQNKNCAFSLPVQVTSVPGLRREGVREIRARYPNFDPEIGSVIDGQIHVHDGTPAHINT
jgi:hypothetical protein